MRAEVRNISNLPDGQMIMFRGDADPADIKYAIENDGFFVSLNGSGQYLPVRRDQVGTFFNKNIWYEFVMRVPERDRTYVETELARAGIDFETTDRPAERVQ